MSISHFFRILWVKRSLILLTTLASLLAGLLVLAIVPPRYSASSRVVLDIMKPDPVTGETVSSSYAGAFVTTQIEIIKDYRVAGRVVDMFDWTSSPQLAAAFQNSGQAGTIDFRRWLADTVIDGTEVKPLIGSNILEIEYTSDNPETAAKVADGLREAYLQETRDQRQQVARRNAEWFSTQTQRLRGQLAEAEKKLTAFEKANNVVITPDGDDAESSRLAAMSSIAPAPSAPMMSAPSVPVMSPSQGQLSQLDASIQSMTATLGPNHPKIVAMRQQRAALASTVAQELAVARAAARGPTVSSGPSAEQVFSAQQAKVLAQRGKAGEARQLAVDVSVLREQVAATAKRAADLQQEAQSNEASLTFLGSATVPRSPTFPKVPLVIFGALALGLALGIGLALLVELLKRKVRGPSDLQIDGVPLLGIAHLERPETRQGRLAQFRRYLPAGPGAAAA